MGFIEIKPTRIRGNREHLKNVVRSSFTKKQTGYNLTMYIGKNIAESINLSAGDKVSISYEESNPRIWLIKKVIDGSGYRLVDVKSKNGPPSSSLRFQLKWHKAIFEPNPDEIGVREMKHEKQDNGILIKNA